MVMTHCRAIRILEHARNYLFSHYGGTLVAMIIVQRLQVLAPTPFVCGMCESHHGRRGVTAA